MRNLSIVFAAVIILAPTVFAGCSGWQTQSDYDPTVEFIRYQTWNWLPEPAERAVDAGPADGFTHARILNAIDKHLTARGYKRSQENPDFLVIYRGGIKDTMTMTQTTDAYKDFPYTEFDWSYTYSYEWRQGYLEIDVFDAASQQLAWRGSVEAEVKPTQDPEKKNERITKAVDAILGKFPPGK